MWIWEKIKSGLSRFVPQHVNDPFGLIGRMVTSKNRAAFFTLWLTVLGLLLTPVDWVLQFFERHNTTRSRNATGPHLFICGPARSGTTLVYQVLARALPVAYPRNFTMMFSRSPILASRIFTRYRKKNVEPNFENFYGKTSGMQSPSEANHLWNQWVMPDDSMFRTVMDDNGVESMARFFTSLSAESGLPTLTKNNNVNAFADVIASHLENAYFICLRRDSRYLAQSLVTAREVINGDIRQSYGVVASDIVDNTVDPITQVLEQITYLDSMALEQQEKIGDKRFWIVDYESFCADPAQLINRVKTEILGHSQDQLIDKDNIPEITNNNRISNAELFKQVEKRLETRTA